MRDAFISAQVVIKLWNRCSSKRRSNLLVMFFSPINENYL